MNRIKKTMQVLTAMLAMVALAACQPDAAIDMDEETITISTLEVQVQQMGGMGGAETRAADRAGTTTRATDPATGMDGVVKTQFVKGDVLHIKVALTVADAKAGKIKYYTATYTDVNGTGTAAWTLNKPIVLPQDATKTAMIEAYYGDVLNNEYTAEEFIGTDVAKGAWETASNGTTTGGLTTYADLLMALGMNDGSGWVSDNGITITPAGKLTIKMVHYQALLRISSITNNLGGDVTGIVANFTNSSTINPVPLTPIPAGMPMVKAEAIAISGQNLASFTVTLTDGSSGSTRDIIVDAPGYNSNPAPGGDTGIGTQLEVGKSYTYKLSLNPGSLTALPTDGMDSGLDWVGQGDPNMPAGYTPIYNRTELAKIETNKTEVKYILMADIDLTPGGNWTPIGTSTAPFKGTFNGNGHIIKGMTISGSDDYQGLFRYIGNNAILYNIHLRDVNVTGGSNSYIGALAGYATNGTISGCSSTGKVSGAANVGGLVGSNQGCHMTRCWSTAAVSGTGNFIGGLVGSNTSNGIIVACYTQESSVSGTGSNSVGGLVGYNDASIFGCYAAQATVTGSSVMGALVGYNSSAVTSCYATNASGSSSNKLVGNNNNGTLIACISPLPGGEASGTITAVGDYAPLIPTDDANKSKKVRTIVLTDGAIVVDGTTGNPAELNWNATGIWGTLTTPVPLAPTINWDYNGEK